MRVVSGKYKGRHFNAPKNLETRPTTDRAKEGLFNILQHGIELNGILALDLFSGIGSISLELLSRGAESVTSVDQNKTCHKFQQSVKKDWNIENWNIILSDVVRFLQTSSAQFDLIFMDPPYEMGLPEELLNEAQIINRLKPDGLLIIEHEKRLDLSEESNFVKSRTYGHVTFSFFEKD